ncbi:MAG: response regulator [Myxacorys californica WJT36-NPBG1]|jgi:DNA-binding response OmpR family regulator/HPt (histidine-containing phosphotransfer) domain-containing protein|nr:response regulator [Myxacorys californica WJT36-NPBG1]
MRVLLVEDDIAIAELVARSLKEHHYAVDIAEDGAIGWECTQSTSYDLILLDVDLPKLDGISLCQRLRHHRCETPIVMMTAKAASEHRIRGLDAGADDYLVKPINLGELQARVRALLRRGAVAANSLLEVGHLRLDPRSCQVTYAKKSLALTPKEYSLLELLLRHPTRVFSCGDIIEHLWTFDDPPQEASVKSHIKGLRQKLKAVGATNWIENVYGLGYRLRERISNAEEDNQKSLTQQYHHAVEELWEQYRETMEERFFALQQAIDSPILTPELRQTAEQAAHKLAGVLGMFERDEGTQIARQLEKIFETESQPQQNQIVRSLLQRLGEILRQDKIPLANSVAESASLLSLPNPETIESESPRTWEVKGTKTEIASIRSWTVLAVDDDPIILATLKQMLEPWGMCVTGIDNPLKFWAVLPQVNPDLLILDVQMPQLSGVVLCQAIRANPAWQSIPIIFLTAHQDSATVQQIFAAGADDYLVKPVVGQELISRLTNRLERIRLLQTLSVKDSITGLPNQFNSSQAIAALINRTSSGCFAIASLADLKQINVQQGHAFGNRILKQTGQRLQAIFCNGEIIGYWGNGEFILGIADTPKAVVQPQLLDALKMVQQDSLQVIYHAAVVEYSSNSSTVRTLYQLANSLLEECQ